MECLAGCREAEPPCSFDSLPRLLKPGPHWAADQRGASHVQGMLQQLGEAGLEKWEVHPQVTGIGRHLEGLIPHCRHGYLLGSTYLVVLYLPAVELI